MKKFIFLISSLVLFNLISINTNSLDTRRIEYLQIKSISYNNINMKSTLPAFEEFCKKFNKHYCLEINNFKKNYFSVTNEFEIRFKIFSENFKSLEAHNQNINKSFEVQISKYADMTKDEVAEKLLNKNLASIPELKFLGDIYDKENKIKNNSNNNNFENYYNIDWRDKGILNDIRAQGECGCCWAFSVVGTVEAMRNIKNNEKGNALSIQQLVDCDSLDKGCKGGWAPNALSYISKNGLVSENTYPYLAKNSNCNSELISKENIETRIESHYSRCDEDECNQGEFQFELLKNGPVAVVMDSYNTNFYNYKSGYYDEECAEPNHAVILVGFGVDGQTGQKYFIIRNSWGKEWGMDGYGYVKHNLNNYWSCNLGRYAFQPKILN